MTRSPAHLRRWQVASTLAIIALAAVATLLGLFRPGHYRDAPALVELYRVQDLTVLAVGIPVLVAGLWDARGGSPRGRVVWLGGLAYMTYMWASVGIQVSFNEGFFLYVALFSLSLFTLVGGVVTTDADAVRAAVEGRITPSLYGGFLVVVALALAALWLSELVPALLDGTTPSLVREVGPQALVTHFLDLAVVVPALLLTAVWLVRRRSWGYVFAGVLLILGAALSVSITSMTLLLVAGEAVTVTPVAALLSVAPALGAALLAVNYVRSMRPTPPPSPGDDGRQFA